MRTVELLEQALEAAQKLGFVVRHEWLGGSGGGACEFGGRKWLFVDLALSSDEQLDQVCRALRGDAGIYVIGIPRSLRFLLDSKQAA